MEHIEQNCTAILQPLVYHASELCQLNDLYLKLKISYFIGGIILLVMFFAFFRNVCTTKKRRKSTALSNSGVDASAILSSDDAAVNGSERFTGMTCLLFVIFALYY